MLTLPPAPRRALSAAGLFAATLLAFVILTIVAFALTLPSIYGNGPFETRVQGLNVFLFDLLDYIFPVACANTCTGWNDILPLVVWGLVALCFGVLARNRPLRYKIIVAIMAIPAIIVLMQWAIDVLGWTQYTDTW
jgi:hypothetical protein